MPGIAGLVSLRPQAECERDLARMVLAMRHDPDYLSGAHRLPDAGLYAGWVARPESFGHGVSSRSVHGLEVCFAGECFWPDAEPSSNSEARTDRFALSISRSGVDTVLPSLRGQFSACVLDPSRRTGWLVNDRFGMERIYIHENCDAFYFASEAKALLAVLPATRALEERSVADFACFGSVLEGRTLFRGIALLPPASRVEIASAGRRGQRRYFVPEAWAEVPADTGDAFEARFAAAFRACIAPYLASPPRVGVSITGGLDTRMLVACGVPAGADAVCYTFDAQRGLTLDSRIGAQVAAARGLKHHVLRLESNFLPTFAGHLDRTVHATDGCAGVLAAHEISFNRQARALASVRITGNFGSEILRSMGTLKPLELHRGLVSPWFRDHIECATAEAMAARTHPLTHAAFREIPWHLFGTLCAARSQLTVRAPFLDNEIVRLAYFAPEEARSTPGTSLRLVAGCAPDLARIPTDRGLVLGKQGPRALLRRLHRAVTFKLDYLDKEGLPGRARAAEAAFGALDRAGLLGLHKYLPYRRWFMNELAGFAHEAVGAIAARAPAWWDRHALDSLARDHADGRANRLKELHVVLTLDAVERTLLRGSYPTTPVDVLP